MAALLAQVTYYDYNAEALIQARNAKGWNQERLGEAIGKHLVTISRVEKKRSASYELVVEMCKALDLRPEDVLWEIVPTDVHPKTINFAKRPTSGVKIA